VPFSFYDGDEPVCGERLEFLSGFPFTPPDFTGYVINVSADNP
jgi:hypothetical protein